MELAHGYTLTDLERLARAACRYLPTAASCDPGEARDVARVAIVERLLTGPWLPASQLVMVGRRAVQDHARAEDRHHGLHRHPERSADSRRPSFAVYWLGDAYTTPGPEDRVVEREATSTILATLTRSQRAALLALAASEDYGAAAELLRLQYNTLAVRVRLARGRFLTLWHEGETPSGLWRRDRRIGVRAA